MTNDTYIPATLACATAGTILAETGRLLLETPLLYHPTCFLTDEFTNTETQRQSLRYHADSMTEI